MKTIKRFFLIILVIILAVAGFFIKRGYDKYIDAVTAVPLDAAVAAIRDKEHYTIYTDIPEIYFKAVVAVEDRRFYYHWGFDVIGMARAAYNDIKARKMIEGGSTVTQQLVKNMYFMYDNSVERKIAELIMAVRLERLYSKQDILELYVNGIFYGDDYYCIYDAAVGYFNKELWEMTPYECTLLAGIPNAPSIYSLHINPELAYKRQNKVVKSMVECGYIKDESEIYN